MFHAEVGRKRMKTEDETGTILFKKFRYRKAENLGQIELSKSGGFHPKSNL